jgi:SAM-dependent methyltransferase
MDNGKINHSGNEFEFAALSEARNYRKAIASIFRPFVTGETLEVGCGIGQFTQDLQQLSPGAKITGLEPDPAFHSDFTRNNPTITLFKGTAQQIGGSWDCIVSVNVLEHIEEDVREIQTYQRLLRKGGHLCIFVPARQEIYAALDAKFGHHRRYSKAQLKGRLEQGGLQVVLLEYFNPVGYISWFIVCKLMQRKSFSVGSVQLFDRWILPASLALGRVSGNPIGQSLILVAKKSQG